MTPSTLPRDERAQHSVSPSAACRLLLAGPPGAGKSTQGRALAERIDVPYLSTGELLRDEVRRETRIGHHAADYMDMGRLVPDWLMVYALESKLNDATQRGFVLDGYPRTVEQAERFQRSLGRFRLDRVIELAVPEDVAMARIATRHRTDDDAQVARTRFHTYRRETGPMLEYFAAAGLLATVDGSRSPEAVAMALSQLIDTQTRRTRSWT